MIVVDELPCLTAARGDAHAVDDVIKARLEQLQEDRARDTAFLGGFGIEVPKRLLGHAVNADQLLLLAQSHRVIAGTTAAALAGLTVLTRGVGAFVEVLGHFVRVKQVDSFAAAELDGWASVTRHIKASSSCERGNRCAEPGCRP